MSDPQHRHIHIVSQPEEPVRRGRNVVAVVGIDQYQHLRLLHNAVSDAKGVRALFVEQLGFQELAPPLYNEQATRSAITSLVVDQLGSQLEADDSLVFFFAGHGYTETRAVGTRTKQTGYLIPVEGAPPDQHKFSTYLRLDALLEEIATLPAMHILVILDACYSGFALGESVQVLRDVQRFSDDLSKRMSRRVIASAMSDQPTLDNGPVSGHSLFTGTLVEALAQGKADDDNKGFVTSSEISLYVQKKVASWSNSQQTPDFGSFELDDRGELVISLVGETQSRLLAQEALEVAEQVLELGWLTGDRKRFVFAAKQYREALRHALLGKIELRAAALGLGRALLAAGETDEAIKVLSELVKHTEGDGVEEAYLHLGMACAKGRDYDAAATYLHAWRTANPEDEQATWVADYVEWLKSAASRSVGRQRALLIGIDNYQGSIANLNGSVNNVKHLMQPLLMHRFDFEQNDIMLLTDSAATREGVLEAFATLKQQSAPGDALLIYYSGYGAAADESAPPDDDASNIFWILHDTKVVENKPVKGIAALELHRLIMEIAATHKTLILDTHSNSLLVSHAEKEGGYNLIVASDSGEMAYESSIEIDGKDYVCGMLSMALYKSLADLPAAQSVTYNEWVNRATQLTQEASAAAGYQRQTPLFIGERSQPVFGRYDPYLFAFEFSQRNSWPESSIPQLMGRFNRFQTFIKAPFPRASEAFDRAFAEKGWKQQSTGVFQEAASHEQLIQETQQVKEQALRAIATFLQEAVEKRQRDDLWPDGRLQLGITYATLKEYASARRTLDEVIRICESGGKFMEAQFIAA